MWALVTLVAILVVVILREPIRAERVEEEHRQAMLASGEFRRCPSCEELIPSKAVRCHYCGRQFTIASQSHKPNSL